MYNDTKCDCIECGGTSSVIPTEKVSHKITPWAVLCKVHGQVFLTAHEYNFQQKEGFSCPFNSEHDVEWDEENYDDYVNYPSYLIEVYSMHFEEWAYSEIFSDIERIEGNIHIFPGKKVRSMKKCIEILNQHNLRPEQMQNIRIRNIFTNYSLPAELICHPQKRTS